LEGREVEQVVGAVSVPAVPEARLINALDGLGRLAGGVVEACPRIAVQNRVRTLERPCVSAPESARSGVGPFLRETRLSTYTACSVAQHHICGGALPWIMYARAMLAIVWTCVLRGSCRAGMAGRNAV
jgi:hypothetical protein